MPDNLDIPDELASLLEKREADEPRRQQQRRAEQAEPVDIEQRSGDERRHVSERRSE